MPMTIEQVNKPLSALSKSDYIDQNFTHSELTSKIISCCIEVHSYLGPGLLEGIYEDALEKEIEINYINFERQKQIELNYKGRKIGKHRVDFLVENEVVLELKSVESLNNLFLAQLITYLRVMDKKVGLLINFNVDQLKYGIKRIIL
jgi:GxxExxY protein